MSIELISSLLAAQRFIFSHTADHTWLKKLDFHIEIFNNFLSDFKQQMAIQECDEYDPGESDEKDSVVDIKEIAFDDRENEDAEHIFIEKIDEDVSKLKEEFKVENEKCNIKEYEKASPKTRTNLSLMCTICVIDFPSLKDMWQHDDENHKKNGQFVCTIENCGKKNIALRNKSTLRLHHSRTHVTGTFICDECGESFQNQYKLKYHVDSKHRKGIFKCDLCQEIFDNIISLKSHRSKHNPNTRHTCELCGKVKTNKEDLERHLAVVHKVDLGEFICNECGKTYASKATLKTHIINVHKEKEFQCDQCDFRAYDLKHLKRHAFVHTGDEAKIVNCPRCEAKFKLQEQLVCHIRKVHEKVRNNKCEICGKAFFSKNKLGDHIKTHTGQKDYLCNFCEKQFIQKSNLKIHMKNVHSMLM